MAAWCTKTHGEALIPIAKLASVMLTGGYGDNRFFSMTEDTLKFIPAGASADHPSVRSAESLISVYKAMGQKSGSSDIEEKAAVLQEKLDSLGK